MNNNRLRLSTIMGFLVAMTALASGTAQAATVTKTVLNDGTTVGFSAPDAAVDSAGNVHIAVQGWTDINNTSTKDIYYLMVGSNGAVRIDATQVNTADAAKESRPRIAVRSDGNVVITFKGTGEALKYVLLDPGADDQSGDAADPGDPLFLLVGETAVGVSTTSAEHDMVLASDGTVHAILQESSILSYLSFDSDDGSAVTTEMQVSDTDWRGGIPAIDIDANGNLHVLFRWLDPTDGFAPVAYLMLDGTDGSTLIDATPLYNASASLQHSSHWSLIVDGTRVHVFYGDKRNTADFDSWCTDCGLGGDMFYARLNPSAHAQDGSAGTITTLREGAETHLGGIWYARAFRDASGRIDVYSTPGSQGSGGDSGNDGSLVHVAVTPTTGGASVGEARLYDSHAVSANWSKHYVTSAGGLVIWVERVFSPVLTGKAYRLVAATAAALSSRPATVIVEDDDGWFGCSLSTGKAPVDPLLPLLAALAGLYLLRRRAAPGA